MCDTCTHCFCENCIENNFPNFLNEVLMSKPWSCFVCKPTAQFKSIVDKYSDISFYSLNMIISQLKPQKDLNHYEKIYDNMNTLSSDERKFLLLFTRFPNKVLMDSDLKPFPFDIVPTYLRACDYIPIMSVLSRSLRDIFKKKVWFMPGLFKTNFLEENHIGLHDHQIVSLNNMADMENSKLEFNALRGGVFADEPGLG